MGVSSFYLSYFKLVPWYLSTMEQDVGTRFASSAYSSLIQDIKGRIQSKFLPFINGVREFQTLFRLWWNHA